jgi:hypothetical protein
LDTRIFFGMGPFKLVPLFDPSKNPLPFRLSDDGGCGEAGWDDDEECPELMDDPVDPSDPGGVRF